MAKAMDPVCKMEVDTESAAATAEYKGKTYYFCAPGCKRTFERDPDKYVEQAGAGHEHEGHAMHGHGSHGH